jgi:hypothetical protein
MSSATETRLQPTTRRTNRRVWFQAITLLLVGLVGYGVAESLAWFGVVDYRIALGTLGDEPWRNPINRLDPDLLHIHHPHRRFRGTMQGGDIAYYLRIAETHTYPYDVQTDRDGFRNIEDIEQADLVMTGDSYVEGILVPGEKTISAELGRLWEISSVNLGQIWYGPQQELFVLQRFGLPRKPKIVVWCYFEGNDLKDMARYETNRERWDVMAPKLHSFSARSLARNASLRLLQYEGPRRHRPLGEHNVGVLPNGERMYFFYRNDKVSDIEKKYMLPFQETIKQAYDTCQKAGIVLVFAYVPIKVRVYDSIVTYPPDSVFRNAYRPEAIEEMKQLMQVVAPGMAFVDLTHELIETSKRELTYFLDDTHWTEAGHAAAARAIARAIPHPAKPARESRP